MRNERFILYFVFSFFLIISCKENKHDLSIVGELDLMEISISEFHDALMNKQTTCSQVVSFYLDRIDKFDSENSEIQLLSIITVNPKAKEIAQKMDQDFTPEKLKEFPLYGVPILVKDNINTKEMPTTGGALVFKDNWPDEDAFIVKKLKEAGAIIIAKANMSEFAFDYKGNSSLGGITKNVYNYEKGAGGSSSGTAVAVSTNLAMAGIGSDTGGSIRIPSSLAGLFGLRPTMNLISQNGIMPLSPWQDTVGPMCRNVEDCARIMSVLAVYDPDNTGNQKVKYHVHARQINNVEEYSSITNHPKDYIVEMQDATLRGVRIGVVRSLFGKDSIAENFVNPSINRAIDSLKAAGAIVKDVEIEDIDHILNDYISMSSYEFQYHIEDYLNSWSVLDDNHVLTFDDIFASGGYLNDSEKALKIRGNIHLSDLDEKQRETYRKNTIERPVYVRTRILKTLDNVYTPDDVFDVLLYPTVINLAATLGEDTKAGRNNRLSAFSGMPAINMVAGMVEDEGVMVPVGIELIGRDFEELKLLKIAHAYEKQFVPRIPPEISFKTN